MNRDSDLDLLVIEPSPPTPATAASAIGRPWEPSPHPLDVIVMATERFEETKNLIGGIAYPARKYGRVLYEAESISATGGRIGIMVLEEVQYVSNESGRPTAVLVPIELWPEIESERETAYLLKSPTMAKRLREARGRTEGIAFDAVIEKLGL
jgi:PHD/YefM family antitoxin component YafN of YafNO toxin-antitoxin module